MNEEAPVGCGKVAVAFLSAAWRPGAVLNAAHQLSQLSPQQPSPVSDEAQEAPSPAGGHRGRGARATQSQAHILTPHLLPPRELDS